MVSPGGVESPIGDRTGPPPAVLARACEQFTGAEIEAVFVDALHESFAEGVEPSAKKHILEAITNTVPLAQLMDGQISDRIPPKDL